MMLWLVEILVFIGAEIEPCTCNVLVIAGGVGGVMGLIVVSQCVIIVIIMLRQKKSTRFV